MRPKRLLLLQNAAFLPLFRGSPNASKEAVRIDQFEPLALTSSGSEAIAEIFRTLSRDRMHAARKVLSYLKENPQPKELIDAARRLVFLKGQNAHDYKFSSAVLEDYGHISPGYARTLSRGEHVQPLWLKREGQRAREPDARSS